VRRPSTIAFGPWTKPLARQLRVLLLFYLLI